jgi:Mn-dependent DtxR family transcriptional regulator
MIGQSVEVFKEYVTVKDIASWMNVSKTTALKYIKKMYDKEEIYMWKEDYKNTYMWKIELRYDIFKEYTEERFLAEYKIYAQRVMKVILP